MRWPCLLFAIAGCVGRTDVILTTAPLSEVTVSVKPARFDRAHDAGAWYVEVGVMRASSGSRVHRRIICDRDEHKIFILARCREPVELDGGAWRLADRQHCERPLPVLPVEHELPGAQRIATFRPLSIWSTPDDTPCRGHDSVEVEMLPPHQPVAYWPGDTYWLDSDDLDYVLDPQVGP